MTAPIEALIARLDAARQTGPGRWLARCPGHDDGRPSLSVQETSDGTVLVHCFAQCSAAEITAAVGMSLADLFAQPRESADTRRHRRRRPVLSARDVLLVLDFERLIVLTVVQDIVRGVTPTPADLERLVLAGQRIQRVREVLR